MSASEPKFKVGDTVRMNAFSQHPNHVAYARVTDITPSHSDKYFYAIVIINQLTGPWLNGQTYNEKFDNWVELELLQDPNDILKEIL